MRNPAALSLLLLALPAVAAGQAAGEELLAETAQPEPVRCVPILRIEHTDIIDDRTIVFYMRGREIYLNRLPNRCAGLKIADAFGYATSLTSLCNVDVIQVLRNYGGHFRSGPACGLGLFEPTTREAIALLKEKPLEPNEDAVMPEIEETLEAPADAAD